MIIIPNNWAELQHYKDRSPPWIKLHKKLLDNYEFQRLPVASRALAPMLWLLASEHEKGEVEASPEKLAFRLRITEKEAEDALQPLVDKGFFSECKRSASKQIAKPRLSARPEAEKRREETDTSPRGRVVSDLISVDQMVAEGIDRQHAKDWLAARSKKKLPLTPTAWADVKAEAGKAGVALPDCIKMAASRGWGGFKAKWLHEGAVEGDDPYGLKTAVNA